MGLSKSMNEANDSLCVDAFSDPNAGLLGRMQHLWFNRWYYVSLVIPVYFSTTCTVAQLSKPNGVLLRRHTWWQWRDRVWSHRVVDSERFFESE